jgi:hypothetical protein
VVVRATIPRPITSLDVRFRKKPSTLDTPLSVDYITDEQSSETPVGYLFPTWQRVAIDGRWPGTQFVTLLF